MSKTMRKMMMGDGWCIGEHESWFSDLAKEGWHLQKIGAFFVHFERGESKDTRYRIDTSSNKNMSDADKEMFKEAGWEHVTKLGEFNIFSSPKELQAAELHTDPVELANTLKKISRKIKSNAISAIILGTLGVATIIALWFIDKTPTLRFILGDFMPVVLTLSLITSTFTALQVNLSIRTLRKKLLEGIAINHHAAWRKKRILTLTIHGLLIIILIMSISILLVQIALEKTQTLPVESDALPIVRLAEIEQNPNLVREEHYEEELLDRLNQYSYNWSLFAPLQYQSNEQGIVPGQLWQEEDVTYSPNLRTQVYQLNFPSMKEKLLADLVLRNIYEGDAIELKSDVFEILLIREVDGAKEVFAAKGKGVIYVSYFGYADTATIIAIIEEKMALIEK